MTVPKRAPIEVTDASGKVLLGKIDTKGIFTCLQCNKTFEVEFSSEAVIHIKEKHSKPGYNAVALRPVKED